jgi:hypothetical protein
VHNVNYTPGVVRTDEAPRDEEPEMRTTKAKAILVERERVVKEIRRAKDERARGERIRELAGLNRMLVLVGWMPEDVRTVVAAN